METFPASLPPTPRPGSWREKGDDPKSRFVPEKGPPITFLVHTAAGALASGEWMLTTAQLQTLIAFHDDVLNYGDDPFLWAHPIHGTVYVWKFEEPPEYTSSTLDAHQVSLSLRRMP